MEDSEAQVYTNFILDIINTSSTLKSGEVCTFGGDEIANAILLRDSKTINLDKNPERFAKCKSVYIAKSSEKILRLEISKFNKNKIMTIGIFEGFVESGGMIQVQMGRRDFEIMLNSKEVKSAAIRLNALVTSRVIN